MVSRCLCVNRSVLRIELLLGEHLKAECCLLNRDASPIFCLVARIGKCPVAGHTLKTLIPVAVAAESPGHELALMAAHLRMIEAAQKIIARHEAAKNRHRT